MTDQTKPSEDTLRTTAEAGDPPALGERLVDDTKYMDPESADMVRRCVEAWRSMPREEFEAAARRL